MVQVNMPSRLDAINEQRRLKLERLRARGIDPYPHRFEQTYTAQEAIKLVESREKNQAVSGGKGPIKVAGRIMAIRKMGKASFIDIRDGSGKIQLLFQTAGFKETQQELFKDLDIGDILGVE